MCLLRRKAKRRERKKYFCCSRVIFYGAQVHVTPRLLRSSKLNPERLTYIYSLAYTHLLDLNKMCAIKKKKIKRITSIFRTK